MWGGRLRALPKSLLPLEDARMMFGNGLVMGLVALAVIAGLATSAMFRRPPKRRWLRTGSVIASAVLGLAVLALLVFASHVVVIEADMSTHEERVIGTATISTGGHDVELTAHGSGVTLVLNESDRPLKVIAVVYGELAPGQIVAPETEIAARSAYTLHGNLDDIGPAHPPPDSMRTNGPAKVRYWLTW